MAGVLRLALVLPELEVEIPLRIFDPFHGLHGNLELAIAKSADSKSWDSADPFDYSEIAFLLWRLGWSLRGSLLPLSAHFLLNAVHEFLRLAVFVGRRLFLFRHAHSFPQVACLGYPVDIQNAPLPKNGTLMYLRQGRVRLPANTWGGGAREHSESNFSVMRRCKFKPWRSTEPRLTAS